MKTSSSSLVLSDSHLFPVAVDKVLLLFQSLVLDGCIVKNVRRVPDKVSLFSTCKPQGKCCALGSS